jgi:hypothetical protein
MLAIAAISLAASVVTPIETEHYTAELPGRWLAHPPEKAGLAEIASYEQQGGPGFLTTSAMVFRGDAPKDAAQRLAALREIVDLRKKALPDLAGGGVLFESGRKRSQDRSGHRLRCHTSIAATESWASSAPCLRARGW